MKQSFFYLLTLFSFSIIFSNCDKSSDAPEVITISGTEAFQSASLSEQWDISQGEIPDIPPEFDEKEYDNVLLLMRYKPFDHTRDFYLENVTAFAKEGDEIDHFHVENVECFLQGNYALYGFSNEWDTISWNGIDMEQLYAENFEDVHFSLGINNEVVYKGNFPEPLPLTKAGQVIDSPIALRSQGITLEWQTENKPDTYVYLHLSHSSPNDLPLDNPRKFTIPDNGSYHITPDMLALLQPGDVIDISLIRDVFVEESNLLIRSMEVQYWSFIPVR
ncbi:MAG: hypothetical protein AAFV95_00910 [Bacteroidota bacterium]